MNNRKSTLTQEQNLKTSDSKARRLPYVTLTIIAVSWLLFLLPKKGELMFPLVQSSNGLLVIWLIHPLLHNDIFHILGNTFGFMIVGSLIESWMTVRPRSRYLKIAVSYLVSLVVGYGVWKAPPGSLFPPVGLSGMIASCTPFLIEHYYRSFSSRMHLQGLNRFAPIGIGFVLASLLLPLPAYSGQVEINFSGEIHLYCFIIAFDIAYFGVILELVRKRFTKPVQN